MKRVRTILLFLLAGALMNVGVAWAASCLIDPLDGHYVQGVVESNGARWEVGIGKYFGITEVVLLITMESSEHLMGSVEVPRWIVYPELVVEKEFQYSRETVRAVGFPLRCLRCEFNSGIVDLFPRSRGGGQVKNVWIKDRNLVMRRESGEIAIPLETIDYIRGGVVLGTKDIYTLDVLPFRPLLAGFAVNTVFWACVIWGMFVAPIRYWNYLERRSRRHRGLCPSCEYALCGVDRDTCPECGAVVIAGGRA